MKFEYLVLPMPREGLATEVEVAWLDEMGEKNWELVQIVPAMGTETGSTSLIYNYYFKRSIEINVKLRNAQLKEKENGSGSSEATTEVPG